MQLRILALAAAIALAGCTEDEPLAQTSPSGDDTAGEVVDNDDGDDTGTPDDGDDGTTDGGEDTAGYGIEGPADPLQAILQDQIFAALIDGSAQAPEQLPADAVLTCLNDTVSIKAVDLVDALAADAEAGQAVLTAPQSSQLAVSVQDLLLSTGGLLLSLTGDTSCSLPADSFPLPSDPSAIPASPEAFMAFLGSLNPGADGGDLPLDPTMLAAQAEQLRAISAGLETAAGAAGAAPVVPDALLLVADLIDNVVDLLGTGAANPADVPGALQALVTDLAGGLTALFPGAGAFDPATLLDPSQLQAPDGFDPATLLDPSQLTSLLDPSALPLPIPGADSFDPEAAFAEFTGAFETLVSTLTGFFGDSPIPVPTP